MTSVDGFERKGIIYHIYSRRLDELAVVDQESKKDSQWDALGTADRQPKQVTVRAISLQQASHRRPNT